MKLNAIIFSILLTLPVFAQADEASKTAKLNELVQMTNINMDAMADSMYSQLNMMLKNMVKEMDVQPSEQAILNDYSHQMVAMVKDELSWDKMEPLIVDVYSRNFSEQEIDDMLAFYKTETGQSMLKKMPIVMQESMLASQHVIQNLLSKVQAAAKKLGQDLAESRKNK